MTWQKTTCFVVPGRTSNDSAAPFKNWSLMIAFIFYNMVLIDRYLLHDRITPNIYPGPSVNDVLISRIPPKEGIFVSLLFLLLLLLRFLPLLSPCLLVCRCWCLCLVLPSDDGPSQRRPKQRHRQAKDQGRQRTQRTSCLPTSTFMRSSEWPRRASCSLAKRSGPPC